MGWIQWADLLGEVGVDAEERFDVSYVRHGGDTVQIVDVQMKRSTAAKSCGRRTSGTANSVDAGLRRPQVLGLCVASAYPSRLTQIGPLLVTVATSGMRR